MKAFTRFEVQFAKPDGSYVRLTSRREPVLSKAEAIKAIRDFLDLMENEQEAVGVPREAPPQ